MRELSQTECRLIDNRKKNRAKNGPDIFKTCILRYNWV